MDLMTLCAAAAAAVCSLFTLLELHRGRTWEESKLPEKDPAIKDPAVILREWFYGEE